MAFPPWPTYVKRAPFAPSRSARFFLARSPASVWAVAVWASVAIPIAETIRAGVVLLQAMRPAVARTPDTTAANPVAIGPTASARSANTPMAFSRTKGAWLRAARTNRCRGASGGLPPTSDPPRFTALGPPEDLVVQQALRDRSRESPQGDVAGGRAKRSCARPKPPDRRRQAAKTARRPHGSRDRCAGPPLPRSASPRRESPAENAHRPE